MPQKTKKTFQVPSCKVKENHQVPPVQCSQYSAQGKKLPVKQKVSRTSSLTDADYEDIFSSVINSSVLEEVSVPNESKKRSLSYMQSTFGEINIAEERATVPDPNEARTPIENSHHSDEGTDRHDVPSKEIIKLSKPLSKINKKITNTNITNMQTKGSHSRGKQAGEEQKDDYSSGIQKTAVKPKHCIEKKRSAPVGMNSSVHNNRNAQQSGHSNKKIQKPLIVESSLKDCHFTCTTIGKKDLKKITKINTSAETSQLKKDAIKASNRSLFHSSQNTSISSNKNHDFSNSSSGIGEESSGRCKMKHVHENQKYSLSQGNRLSWSQGSQVRQLSQTQRSDIPLSQPPSYLSPRERLEWLQKRRDVGVWVQCCRPVCSKWRYLADVKDPIDVPHEWFCSMNADKQHNSCASPEHGPNPLEEEDLIHNLYTAGSLVWAQLVGYPWWPAIVDDDPDIEQYYWLNSFSDIPTHYSVAFFDDKLVSRAWITPGSLRPYKGQALGQNWNKMVYHGINYEKRLKVAKEQADKAYGMELSDRLKDFSFIARYKGPIGKRKKNKKNHHQEIQNMESEEDLTASQMSCEDDDSICSVIMPKRKKKSNDESITIKRQKKIPFHKCSVNKRPNTSSDNQEHVNNGKSKDKLLPKSNTVLTQSCNRIVPKFSKVSTGKSSKKTVNETLKETEKTDEIRLSQDIFLEDDCNDVSNNKEKTLTSVQFEVRSTNSSQIQERVAENTTGGPDITLPGPSHRNTSPGSRGSQQDSGIATQMKSACTVTSSISDEPNYEITMDLQRVPSLTNINNMDAVVPEMVNLEEIVNTCEYDLPQSDDFEPEE